MSVHSLTKHLAAVPDDGSTEPTLAEDAARYLGLQAQVEEITTELERIKTRLRAELEAGDHDLDGVKVRITQPTRFDPTLATANLGAPALASITRTETWVSPALVAELLTPEQLEAVSTVTRSISAELAKAQLEPATYRTCCAPSGTARVSVK